MQEVLKKLEEHDKRFSDHDKRFDQIDGQIDFIAKKVLEHDEQFEWVKENMATRADISKMTNTLDKLVKLAETKDQELTLISHGLRDVEDKVKEHDLDIRKMKPALGLS
jgi:DNA repair ATPase RecN